MRPLPIQRQQLWSTYTLNIIYERILDYMHCMDDHHPNPAASDTFLTNLPQFSAFADSFTFSLSLRAVYFFVPKECAIPLCRHKVAGRQMTNIERVDWLTRRKQAKLLRSLALYSLGIGAIPVKSPRNESSTHELGESRVITAKIC